MVMLISIIVTLVQIFNDSTVDLIIFWCELIPYYQVDPREMDEASFIFLAISFPLVFLFEQILKNRKAVNQLN